MSYSKFGGRGTHSSEPNSLLQAANYFLRLSNAENYVLVEEETIDIGRDECNWSREKNSDGEKYIIRVDTFRCFLKKEWGDPITTTSKSDIEGKKGVIAFKDCQFRTASAHIDLFDGSDCVNACYFSRCKWFDFFEM